MSIRLVTGPITGRIPIDHPDHAEGWVDVTPDALEFETLEQAQAVADAIEDEHNFRGTHPALETGGI